MAATEEDVSLSAEARLLTQQQLDWMADLDGQEPKLVDGLPDEPVTEVYTRPAKPGAIPKLQGPFYLDLAPVLDGEDEASQITDIYVVGEKMNTGDLMTGEDVDLEFDDSHDGLSLSVICLLTDSGQVQIYLDTDGVEAQWLPTRKMKLAQANGNGLESEFPTLLNFHTLETQTPTEIKNVKGSWPVFSGDATSRYAFFVTQSTGITFVSLTSWVFRLESELQSESEAGSKFRIDLLAKGNGSTREKVFVQKREICPLAACASIRDPDLGYFIISATNNNAVAVFFDVPENEIAPRSRPLSSSGVQEEEEERQALTMWEPRPYFHASGALDEGSRLPQFVDHLKAGPRRPLMQQEVRMSPVTLEIFTDTHKLVSAELDPLNTAVAELFRKCEALQAELREQIGKTNEVRQRVEAISGEDVEDEESVSEAVRIQTRLERAQSRQEELAQRMEKVKSKLGKVSSRELSDYERAWMSEVKALESTILGTGEMAAQSTSKTRPPLKRLEEIKRLKDDLAAQVSRSPLVSSDGQHEKDKDEEGPGSPGPNHGVKVPVDIRKAKYAQVRMMLDRESALVEGVKTRLEQLNVG
jgi:nucleoporin NUP82